MAELGILAPVVPDPSRRWHGLDVATYTRTANEGLLRRTETARARRTPGLLAAIHPENADGRRGGAPNTPYVTREATGAWRGQNTAIDAASLWEHDREKGLSGVGADTKKTGSRSRTNGAEVRLGGF